MLVPGQVAVAKLLALRCVERVSPLGGAAARPVNAVCGARWGDLHYTREGRARSPLCGAAAAVTAPQWPLGQRHPRTAAAAVVRGPAVARADVTLRPAWCHAR